MIVSLLIDAAREEYAELGVIPTDTYMALTNAGLNPESLAAQFERELENDQ